ncbi:MAG: hypothetical protein ACR2HV_03270 [Acidimicrobiales bacterium]
MQWLPALRLHRELAGSIASAAFTSGHRFVVGIWEQSPLGPMADVMWTPPGGERVLLVAREEVGAFIPAVYRFDRVEVVALECRFEGPTLRVSAGDLQLTMRGGRDWPIPLPRLRSREPFRRVEAAVARRLLGVRTFGTSPTGSSSGTGPTGTARPAGRRLCGCGRCSSTRPGIWPGHCRAYLTGPRRSTGTP